MTLNTNQNSGSKTNRSLKDVNLLGILPPKISKIPLVHQKEVVELKMKLKVLEIDFRKKKSDYKLMKVAGKKESKLLKMKTQIKALKYEKVRLTTRLSNLNK